MWEARAKYADGTSVERLFAYNANGNYLAEQEEQYQLECWLLERHEGCIWYSVDYIAE